jgi:hypothetical protein
VGLDLAGGQARGDQGDDQVVHAGQASLALADELGLEAAGTVPRHGELDGAGLGQHGLGAGAVAGVAAVAAGGVAVLVAQVVGQLALEGVLEHELCDALQQPVRADQADPVRAGLLDQLRGELLVDRVSCGLVRSCVLVGGLGHVVSPPVRHQRTLSRSYTVVLSERLGLLPPEERCWSPGWVVGWLYRCGPRIGVAAVSRAVHHPATASQRGLIGAWPVPQLMNCPLAGRP